MSFMSILVTMLVEQAVYWPPANPTTDNYGRPVPVSSGPISILCRWEDTEYEHLDMDGRVEISKALVYVSQDVLVGGILYLGTVDDTGFDPINPFNNPSAHEIKRYIKLPTLDGTQYLRTAFL